MVKLIPLIMLALAVGASASTEKLPENFHVIESCGIEDSGTMKIVFTSPAELRRTITFNLDTHEVKYRGEMDTPLNASFADIQTVGIDCGSILFVKLKNGASKILGEINQSCESKLVDFAKERFPVTRSAC